MPGDLIWEPTTESAAASTLGRYLRWSAEKKGRSFTPSTPSGDGMIIPHPSCGLKRPAERVVYDTFHRPAETWRGAMCGGGPCLLPPRRRTYAS